MFRSTISEINAEIQWINFELGRQSTTPQQEANLKIKKAELQLILNICEDYDRKMHEIIKNADAVEIIHNT